MDVVETNGKPPESAPRDLEKQNDSDPVAPSQAGVEETKVADKKAKIFAADVPRGADALGLASLLRPLAELAVHAGTEPPLTIALLGEPGCGKSFALGKLLAEIEALSGAAVGAPLSPFLTNVATLNIDAATLDGEPSVALARAFYDGIKSEFPAFVREVAHAVRDPQIVAREAAERLDEARRRLDAERQKLEEIEMRRARLAETVLYESAGSQVDAYARTNRAKIESRLAGFGIEGDTIANYKSMLRDVAESGGPGARLGAASRAFWAFRGQGGLLLTAAIFALLGLGLDIAVADKAKWLDVLRNASQGLASAATWSEAHIGWLALAARAAYAAAAFSLLVNIWRGLRFLRPLLRGVGLLQTEVVNRRRALDALYAHQVRRVDGVEADVALATRRAAEADRRAGHKLRADPQAEPSPFEDASPKAQADRFFAAIGTFMDGMRRSGAGGAASAGPASVPQRLVVAIDGLDILPRTKAHALLETAHRAFANSGVVTLMTANLAGFGEGAPLEKWIQVPCRLAAPSDYAAFVAHLSAMGEPSQPKDSGDSDLPTERPPVDWSISAAESDLLAKLATLAGGSPRAVKRFVNLYRLARAQAPEHRALLALMLALEQGGTAGEIATVAEALADGDPDADLDLQHATPRLFAALQMVKAREGRVSLDDARHAAAVAKRFSLRA